MAEKIIKHPLRDIVLQYDETKPQTDYEKDLVKKYIVIHDRIYSLLQQSSKLSYEYLEHDDRVTQAYSIFEPVAETLKAFKLEAEEAAEKEKSQEHLNELFERMEDYYANIDDFHQKTLNPLSDEADALQRDFNRFAEEEEQFDKDYDRFDDEDLRELYHNYDAHSLDMASFDEDHDHMKGVFQKIDAFIGNRDKVIDNYNNLMRKVKAAYDEWDATKRMASEFFDDTHMLDSSLSESFIGGKGDKSKMPLYLIPPGDKRIQEFKDNMGMMGNSMQKTMQLAVPVEVVNAGDLSTLQEMVMMFQHFPKLIEKMLFSIQLEFLNADGMPLQDDDWKGHEMPVRWISKFRSIPCILFFLEDHDTRAYFLMGDLLSDGKITPEGEGVFIEGETAEELTKRLFESCWFFMLYCHNTGFDPTPYIESILADFDLPITMEQISDQYEKSIRDNIQLQVRTVKSKGQQPPDQY